MAIAATTGASVVRDIYGLRGATTNSQTAHIPIMIFKSDSTWTDDGNLYGRVGVLSSVVTEDTDNVLTEVSVGQRFTDDTAIDHTTAYDSTWIIGYSVDNGTIRCNNQEQIDGIGKPAPSLNLATFSVTTDTAPASAKYVDVNVHGFFYAELPKQDSATQALIEPYEVTPTHDESTLPPAAGIITLFDENMPCSAYLMKVLICGNANAVGFRTLTSISFPLVGSGTYV